MYSSDKTFIKYRYYRHHPSYFSNNFLFFPLVCPGVRESSQQVSQVRDSYSWVLNIPNKNLRMNFQEVSYYLKRLECTMVNGNGSCTILKLLNCSSNCVCLLFRCWLIWVQRMIEDSTRLGSGHWWEDDLWPSTVLSDWRMSHSTAVYQGSSQWHWIRSRLDFIVT